MSTIVDELVAILGYRLEGEGNVKRYEASLNRLATSASKFASRVGTFVGIGASVVTAALGKMGMGTVETAGTFEQLQAALETVYKDSDKAAESMEWVAKQAAVTPYEVEELTRGFVNLVNQGIDPTVGALKTVGDAASAMSLPLDMGVQALTDAMTFQFERLKAFGVTTSTIGNQVTFGWVENGKRFEKTLEKNGAAIQDFVLEYMEKRFGGGMEKQARTWKGMVSNMSDAWSLFQLRIAKAGIFDTLKDRLKSVLDSIDKFAADGTLDRWAKSISDAMSVAFRFFDKFVSRVVADVRFLVKHFDSFKGPLKTIGLLFAFLIARAFPVTTAFFLIGAAIDDLIAYLDGGESKIGDFIKALQELLGVSEETAQRLGALGGVVAGALAIALLTSPLKTIKLFGRLWVAGLVGLSPVLGRAVWFLGVTLAGKLLALAPMISEAIAALIALASNPIGWAVLIAAGVGALVWYFWDDLKEAWGTLSEKVPELWKQFTTWLMDQPWVKTGIEMLEAIWNGFNNAFGGIPGELVALFTRLIDAAIAMDWIGLGSRILTAIWNGMKAVWESIKNWFASAFASLQNYLPSFSVSPPVLPEVPKAPSTRPPESDVPQVYTPTPEELSKGKNKPTAAVPSTKAPMPAPTAVRGGPPSPPKPSAVSDAATTKAVANLRANLAKANGPNVVNTTMNDNRSDNRQAPMTVNATVNQTVTQPTDAPKRVAQATMQAVKTGVASQRTQIETEPAF